jgi:hypothetical protein
MALEWGEKEWAEKGSGEPWRGKRVPILGLK